MTGAGGVIFGVAVIVFLLLLLWLATALNEKLGNLVDAERDRFEDEERVHAQLTAAEDVCLLMAWCSAPSPDTTDEEKALHELWRVWHQFGVPLERREHPHLNEQRVAELAAQFDADRARTMPWARGEASGDADGTHTAD